MTRNPFAPERCNLCKTTKGSVLFMCIDCAIMKCKHMMHQTTPSRCGVCLDCATTGGRHEAPTTGDN